MKIAVLYFGQPRFVNNEKCFSTQSNKIFSQGEVDVFAHLWENTNEGYGFSTWSGMNECPSDITDVKTFVEKWKPIRILSEPSYVISNDNLFKKLHDRLPGGDDRLRNFNNCLSQLYSLEECIKLYETYVEETNVKYDLVIVLRTDICVWDFPILKELDNNYFYFSSLFSANHFADLCYIMGAEYIKGLKVYSYLTNENSDVNSKLHFGNAESIKRLSVLNNFDDSKLRQVPIPVRVVRTLDDIGKQW
jgi:hypothetical protein